MLDAGSNLHADASFRDPGLLLYKGGFCGSAHVPATTLGYIFKTN